MRVKPNPNKKVGDEKLQVFDPVRREFLPETGRDVPRTAYWLRRLQTGDVILDDGTAPAVTETKQKPEAQASKKNEKAKSPKKEKAKQPAKTKKEAAKAQNQEEVNTKPAAKEE